MTRKQPNHLTLGGPCCRCACIAELGRAELQNVFRWLVAGSAWLGAAVQELVRRHDSLLPQDVANALVGLAKLHWQPSAAQLHELLIAGLTNSAPRPLELTQVRKAKVEGTGKATEGERPVTNWGLRGKG